MRQIIIITVLSVLALSAVAQDKIHSYLRYTEQSVQNMNMNLR